MNELTELTAPSSVATASQSLGYYSVQYIIRIILPPYSALLPCQVHVTNLLPNILQISAIINPCLPRFTFYAFVGFFPGPRHGIAAAGSQSQTCHTKSRSPWVSSWSNERVCDSYQFRSYNREYHLVERLDSMLVRQHMMGPRL